MQPAGTALCRTSATSSPDVRGERWELQVREIVRAKGKPRTCDGAPRVHRKPRGALAHEPEAEKARMGCFLKYLLLYITFRYLVKFVETQNLALEKLDT